MININFVVTSFDHNICFFLQTCKFQVGSYSFDMKHIIFKTVYRHGMKKNLLDYSLQVQHLKKKDTLFFWAQTLSNFSLGGFEMQFRRNMMKYIIEYYLPSGLFVIVSWVRLSLNIWCNFTCDIVLRTGTIICNVMRLY